MATELLNHSSGRQGVSCLAVSLASLLVLSAGCTAQRYRASVDRTAYGTIRQKQIEAMGRTNAFTIETAADELRQRLLIGQDLPRSGPSSLGSRYLSPIDHWPGDDYLGSGHTLVPTNTSNTNQEISLSLVEALQVAARNSRQYQSSKESVFRSALGLDLERDEFRNTFAGVLSGSYEHDRSGLQSVGGSVDESLSGFAGASMTRRLKSGAQLTLQLGWDIVRLLQPGTATSKSLFGDASVSIPLLRGAGRHIVTESLTQAERDVVYAMYDFEEFKRSFAVQIASRYLAVLQRQNEVQNAEQNYRSLITSTRRVRRLLDAGQIEPIQVDQAIQNELSARNRWVSARESYISTLDAFKVLLGLPTDARLALEINEFEKLSLTVTNATTDTITIQPRPYSQMKWRMMRPPSQRVTSFQAINATGKRAMPSSVHKLSSG